MRSSCPRGTMKRWHLRSAARCPAVAPAASRNKLIYSPAIRLRRASRTGRGSAAGVKTRSTSDRKQVSRQSISPQICPNIDIPRPTACGAPPPSKLFQLAYTRTPYVFIRTKNLHCVLSELKCIVETLRELQ